MSEAIFADLTELRTAINLETGASGLTSHSTEKGRKVILPPWDELDGGVRDWFRGVAFGCILGVLATSLVWVATALLTH